MSGQWVHTPPPRPRPHVCLDLAATLSAVFKPIGSVWQCSGCGQRWVKRPEGMVKTGRTAAAELLGTARPEMGSITAARLRVARGQAGMADVGLLEKAEALVWLDQHIDGVYRDLGLVRRR